MKKPFHELDDAELDEKLRHSYAEARKDGNLYSRSSLLCLRNAIERHLNNPPINRGINLSKSEAFKQTVAEPHKIERARKQGEYTTQTSDSARRPTEAPGVKCSEGRQPMGPTEECLVPHQPLLVPPWPGGATKPDENELQVHARRQQQRMRCHDPRRGHKKAIQVALTTMQAWRRKRGCIPHPMIHFLMDWLA